jgi:hypothetical protein
MLIHSAVRNKQIILFLFVTIVTITGLQAQKLTKIKGQITDKSTGEPLPFVNVFFEGKDIGTVTDYDGHYELITQWASEKLTASFIGYNTQTKTIEIGKSQVVDFVLVPENVSLGEVVVKSKKKRYRNKNNPAVELIKKAINNKDKNRLESLDFYEYKKYEKVELDLNNITEKFQNKKAFKKFQFVFDYIDTSEVNGKPYLPVFLKESLSDVYYRKSSKTAKEYVNATKIINFHEYLDDAGFNLFINYMYQDIDIYQNTINILTNDFVSPLSPLAPITYKFRIIDTLDVNGYNCIELAFQPRNKLDFAFIGKMYITNDDRYAVVKLKMKVSDDINLNFVNDLEIKQEFSYQNNQAWVLKKDKITIDFNIGNKNAGVFGTKSVDYGNFKFNKVAPDSIYEGIETTVYAPDYMHKTDDYWETHRIVPLSPREANIYTMVDSLKEVPLFKTSMNVIMLFVEAYWNIDWLDLGPISTFISFNEVEGTKLKLGGQTSDKFSKTLRFAGYGIYGLEDKKFKYSASVQYSLNGNSLRETPLHFIKFKYVKDTKFPGMNLMFANEGNLFLSFKRGVADKLLYYELFDIEHYKDWVNGFSTRLNLRHIVEYPGGTLEFNYDDYSIDKITLNEIETIIRFAPNEKYYLGMSYRVPILSKYPIIQLTYTQGIKGLLGGDYTYTKLRFNFFKRIYLSPMGFTNFELEAGKVFTKEIPYPLLFIHRANQTYSYQTRSYNLMNFLEFVSDQYVSISAEHHFYGFFFNKIPVFRRLKWREVITFKGIYGNVSDENNPEITQGLMLFPTDAQGNTTTFSLQEKPYMEAGVGIENIFKFFRIDLVRRLTYLNNPNVDEWGIRMSLKFDF